jgi:hypothetical protein
MDARKRRIIARSNTQRDYVREVGSGYGCHVTAHDCLFKQLLGVDSWMERAVREVGSSGSRLLLTRAAVGLPDESLSQQLCAVSWHARWLTDQLGAA